MLIVVYKDKHEPTFIRNSEGKKLNRVRDIITVVDESLKSGRDILSIIYTTADTEAKAKAEAAYLTEQAIEHQGVVIDINPRIGLKTNISEVLAQDSVTGRAKQATSSLEALLIYVDAITKADLEHVVDGIHYAYIANTVTVLAEVASDTNAFK